MTGLKRLLWQGVRTKHRGLITAEVEALCVSNREGTGLVTALQSCLGGCTEQWFLMIFLMEEQQKYAREKLLQMDGC